MAECHYFQNVIMEDPVLIGHLLGFIAASDKTCFEPCAMECTLYMNKSANV